MPRSMNFVDVDLDALASAIVDQAEQETYHGWLDRLNEQAAEAAREAEYDPAVFTDEDAEALRRELVAQQLDTAFPLTARRS